jgi:hypothetical protein
MSGRIASFRAMNAYRPFDYFRGVDARRDPYIDSVTFLFNGVRGAGDTSFVNIAPNTNEVWNRLGNAVTSSAQTPFGETSLLHDGSGDYWTTATQGSGWDFGSGDFTIEAWVYRTATGDRAIITNWQGVTAANCAWLMYATSTSKLQLSYGIGTLNTGTASATSLTLNTWQHLVAQRRGATLEYFIHGTRDANTANLSSSALNTTPTYAKCVGAASPSTGGSLFMNGYIGPMRITKGVARYGDVATIPVPTTFFPTA